MHQTGEKPARKTGRKAQGALVNQLGKGGLDRFKNGDVIIGLTREKECGGSNKRKRGQFVLKRYFAGNSERPVEVFLYDQWLGGGGGGGGGFGVGGGVGIGHQKLGEGSAQAAARALQRRPLVQFQEFEQGGIRVPGAEGGVRKLRKRGAKKKGGRHRETRGIFRKAANHHMNGAAGGEGGTKGEERWGKEPGEENKGEHMGRGGKNYSSGSGVCVMLRCVVREVGGRGCLGKEEGLAGFYMVISYARQFLEGRGRKRKKKEHRDVCKGKLRGEESSSINDYSPLGGFREKRKGEGLDGGLTGTGQSPQPVSQRA